MNDRKVIYLDDAIDALAKMMPKSYTPDGSHPADEEIFRAQEIFADCIKTIEILPSAQPEIIHCKDCKHWREGGAYSYCQILFNCGVLDVYDYMRAEDDFCSLAERREDG